ncbi:MAG: hypothetical protein QME12_06830 [Nanoarchaeota archaeon]|nr:hypothetical protein [Nanoarchaeota archaeon]
MKIQRAVKAAAIKLQLENALAVAEKAGIRGIEIQEILPLVEEVSFEQRGDIVVKACAIPAIGPYQ